MLDLDVKEAEARIAARARRRRLLKRLLVDALLLLVLAIGLVPLGAVWLLLTPEGLQRLLPLLVDEDNVVVTVDRVALHPASRPFDPESWGLIVYDLDIAPRDPTRARVRIEQVLLLGPDLRRLDDDRELHVRRAALIGMHIDARVQRASAPRERPKDALRLLSADKASFWDARYTAPADDPLPAAAFEGIYVETGPMTYDPFARLVHGSGWLAGARLQSGDLVFSHIRIASVEATGRDLKLAQGSLRWEGVRARVRGALTGIDRRATVKLTVDLTQTRIEALVRNATGQPSPVLGLADLHLEVFSGGDLPRGGGYMTAAVRLRDVVIPLPAGTRGIYKDAVRLAPIAKLDDQDRVLLDELEGSLRLTRGRVKIGDLIYKSKVPILIRGEIDTERLDLLFRIVLGGDPATHPGIGLRLAGPHGELTATRATREELLPGWREKKAEAKETAREERRERREQRRRERREAAAYTRGDRDGAEVDP